MAQTWVTGRQRVQFEKKWRTTPSPTPPEATALDCNELASKGIVNVLLAKASVLVSIWQIAAGGETMPQCATC